MHVCVYVYHRKWIKADRTSCRLSLVDADFKNKDFGSISHSIHTEDVLPSLTFHIISHSNPFFYLFFFYYYFDILSPLCPLSCNSYYFFLLSYFYLFFFFYCIWLNSPYLFVFDFQIMAQWRYLSKHGIQYLWFKPLFNRITGSNCSPSRTIKTFFSFRPV